VEVSARLEQGGRLGGYILQEVQETKRCWLLRIFGPTPPYTYYLNPRDESGARSLGQLRDQGISSVATTLAQSTDHILSFFQALRSELAFYIGCLNLHGRLKQTSLPLTFPRPVSNAHRQFEIVSLYDMILALEFPEVAVGNDVSATGKDLVIITGANQGGKSTFLRSIGVAQLMMHAGMFVVAESFLSQISSSIVTHYKREEDVEMRSGKFDEELSRMSEIVSHLPRNAMVLFNESFASTDEREGSEIAAQIARALIESGIRVIFVTHLFSFARRLYDQKLANALFLRAERLLDGRRTFRMQEGEPLQTSYGKDLYEQVFAEEPASRKSEVNSAQV
jgi:DNA mismatch repair ATPase MutS